MSVKYAPSKLRVPSGFQNLLEGLAREILREQPENIIQFAANYFKDQLKQRYEGNAGGGLHKTKVSEESEEVKVNSNKGPAELKEPQVEGQLEDSNEVEPEQSRTEDPSKDTNVVEENQPEAKPSSEADNTSSHDKDSSEDSNAILEDNVVEEEDNDIKEEDDAVKEDDDVNEEDIAVKEEDIAVKEKDDAATEEDSSVKEKEGGIIASDATDTAETVADTAEGERGDTVEKSGEGNFQGDNTLAEQAECEETRDESSLTAPTEEKVIAATKIQATFRGMKARKSLKAASQEDLEAQKEEIVETEADTVTIESVGGDSGQHLEDNDQSVGVIDDGANENVAQSDVSSKEKPDEDVDDEKTGKNENEVVESHSHEEVVAATKIQSLVRGNKARKEVEKLKAASKENVSLENEDND